MVLTALGGCSEAERAVSGGLSVVEARGEPTTFGNAEITVTVENTASESKSGTLNVEVELDNGQTYTKSRYIRVPGESTDTFEFTIDISIVDAFSSNEGTLDAWIE